MARSLPTSSGLSPAGGRATGRIVATFSIVAADPSAEEVGVAVASRFFAVGAVVPFAAADVGAIATQAAANVTYGPRGLELLARGATPSEVGAILTRGDVDVEERQFGVVAADGASATFTGSRCLAWAGGRSGPSYAVQGNILAGEAVVVAMEAAFLRTPGTLAERMYAALAAGDERGGDARGRQSAALMVRRHGAGYGGGDDRAIDVRVDDHLDPIVELGRLLRHALLGDAWAAAWAAFVAGDHAVAAATMERAARLAPDNSEVMYDLAVVRLASDARAAACEALAVALRLDPDLAAKARADADLEGLRADARFADLVK